MTFASSLMIVSAQQFVPPNVCVSDEPKQMRGGSEVSSVSKKMWAEFEKYWSAF